MVALTVLGMLSEQPSHTYEIQRQIRNRHKDFAAGKTRALYRAIEELVERGLAEPLETTREGRRPERTVYQITAAGRDELEEWLTQLLEHPVAEYPVFSIAIGFLPYLTQDQALRALRSRTVALRAEIAAHREQLRALMEDAGLPRLVLLELEHAVTVRDAELRWVAGLADDIHRGVLHWDVDWLIEHLAEHSALERAQAADDLEAAVRREQRLPTRAVGRRRAAAIRATRTKKGESS